MKIILLVFLMLSGTWTSAQVQPVEWTFYSKKINDTQFEIHLKATIEKGWYIYSQFTPSESAGITSIKVENNNDVRLGKRFTEQGTLLTRKETLYGTVKYFEGEVDFIMPVTVQTKANITVKGTIDFVAAGAAQKLPSSTVQFSLPLNLQ